MKKSKLLMSCIFLSYSLICCSSCSSNITTNNEPAKIYFYNVDGKIHINEENHKMYFVCDLDNGEVTCFVNPFITSVYDVNNVEIGSLIDENVKKDIVEGKEMIGGLYYVTNENNNYFDFPFSVMRLQYKK